LAAEIAAERARADAEQAAREVYVWFASRPRPLLSGHQAAAGEIGEGVEGQRRGKLLAGYRGGDMTYKVHLDGYNLVPYLTGQVQKSPRQTFLYINDDQQMVALWYDNFKIVFEEQRASGQLLIWANPFTSLRVPKIFNLRTDPYERADITSNTYYDWLIDHVFLLVPAQDNVAQFIATFREYPQRQKAASFNLDDVLQKMKEAPK
jgi:arylsulfatase